ncbi:hypothetical protein TgHK011_009738 [Trichoderma gracile]|nr:hypothetical protein TgHK011_009738 [Trichoderma gracile]
MSYIDVAVLSGLEDEKQQQQQQQQQQQHARNHTARMTGCANTSHQGTRGWIHPSWLDKPVFLLCSPAGLCPAVAGLSLRLPEAPLWGLFGAGRCELAWTASARWNQANSANTADLFLLVLHLPPSFFSVSASRIPSPPHPSSPLAPVLRHFVFAFIVRLIAPTREKKGFSLIDEQSHSATDSKASPRHVHKLQRRGLNGSIIGAILLGVVIFIIALVLIIGYIKRRKNNKKAKYERAHGDDTTEPPAASSNRNNAAAGTVDRNTSVRSVMTLPAYRQMASHNEQVLGREGERDGIDVIVDLPTEEELEALRDEEMESMYQIRLARRQMIEEQQQRRAAREEARRRGDTAALAELRARARAASNNNSTIEELRREMERAKENRNLSVSSVSYADVGLARHDGTRIRANSTDSERMGLLSDSASIGMTEVRSHSQAHTRGMSGSSVISMDSGFASPALTRRSGDSHTNTPGQAPSEARAGSSPELVEADLGEEAMPPPGYEDVSLADDDDDFRDRSMSQIHEPPPEYPGSHRSNSQRGQTSPSLVSASSEGDPGEGALRPAGGGGVGGGVGGIPRLPSLRISELPAIVVEPSSAQPPDHEHEAEAERRL